MLGIAANTCCTALICALLFSWLFLADRPSIPRTWLLAMMLLCFGVVVANVVYLAYLARNLCSCLKNLASVPPPAPLLPVALPYPSPFDGRFDPAVSHYVLDLIAWIKAYHGMVPWEMGRSPRAWSWSGRRHDAGARSKFPTRKGVMRAERGRLLARVPRH